MNLKNLNAEQIRKLVPVEDLILLGYRGSIAHNMYTPQDNPDSIDDRDILGVFVNPLSHYLGFGKRDVIEKFIGEWDAVSYEVRKFIGLLLKCNPNVLSLLWLPDKHYIFRSPLGDLLIENRSVFVSKAAYHSFSGYAHGQFKRMTQYHTDGYMGAKRKLLVDKFGFDPKNASHLIRILKMGIEFLIEGELHVERDDAEQLLEIKRGEWPLEKVKSEAEHLFRLAEKAYVRSTLPPKPDIEKAEKLCMEIIMRKYGIGHVVPCEHIGINGLR